MKRLALALALALTGCATYTNPVTGQQEVALTAEGANVIAGALAVGVTAAAVGAVNRNEYRAPYYRVETCSRRGCTTTRYYRKGY